MQKPLSKARRNVLVQLERILGSEFYNGNARNYGPGGLRLSDGRSFRYPLTLRSPDGSRMKVRTVPPTGSDDMVRTGYYAVGANQFDVMAGLEGILHFLEEHHGLVIEEPKEEK